jgi:hypothetical protein
MLERLKRYRLLLEWYPNDKLVIPQSNSDIRYFFTKKEALLWGSLINIDKIPYKVVVYDRLKKETVYARRSNY